MKRLLYLNKIKKTNDGFDYEMLYYSVYDNNNIEWRYTLPNINEIHQSYYLVQVDIKKLKKLMGESETYDMGHSKIYTINNIELLGWLLAGLHRQERSSKIDRSFLFYYFILSGRITIPIVNGTQNKLHIIDGRHRLGFYNYFGINGLVLTDRNGINFMDKNDVVLKYANLKNYLSKSSNVNISSVDEVNNIMECAEREQSTESTGRASPPKLISENKQIIENLFNEKLSKIKSSLKKGETVEEIVNALVPNGFLKKIMLKKKIKDYIESKDIPTI